MTGAPAIPFTPGGFRGIAWRAIFPGQDPRRPVGSPEGRFHHSGLSAIYTSLTPEGCIVAMQRYLRADESARIIVPLTLDLTRVADLRGRREPSAVWQDARAAGLAAPTWAFSDAARDAGAQAMLYSSRSRPDLTHLAIFCPPEQAILATGTPIGWPACS